MERGKSGRPRKAMPASLFDAPARALFTFSSPIRLPAAALSTDDGPVQLARAPAKGRAHRYDSAAHRREAPHHRGFLETGCGPVTRIDELNARGHQPNGPLRGVKSDTFDGGNA